MGTEVYELADALLADLLESDERWGVLARYRSDHAWDADSIGVVLQMIADLHASGRLSDESLVELRSEIRSWSAGGDDEATDELPALAGIALDDPTEELDDDTDVTVVLPPEMQQQLGIAAGSEQPAATSEQDDDIVASVEQTPAEPIPPEPPSLELGTLVANRYRLDRLIGEGGYCLVFRARDLRHEQLGGGEVDVALKALRPELFDDERAIARLKQEFRTVGYLSHPGIVRVLDLDCDTGQWFFTMECLDGESLAAALRARGGRPLPLEEALPILTECAAALDFAHSRGHVHGDLKPANVFLTAAAEAKLLDWSGGVDVAREEESVRGGRAATRAYASPEVLDGAWPNRADDLFSLACVAYEMLTGLHPFEGQPASDWRELGRRPPPATGVPAGAAAALDAALGWTRAERPDSAAALVEELARPPAEPTRPILATVEGTEQLSPIDHPALVETRDFESRAEPEPAAAPVGPVVPVPIVSNAARAPWLQRPVLIALAALVGVALFALLMSRSDDEQTTALPPLEEPTTSLEPAPVAPQPEVPPIGTTAETAAAGPTDGGIAGLAGELTSPEAIANAAAVASSPPAAAAVEGTLPVPADAQSASVEVPPVTSAPPPAVTWVSFESADVVTSEAAVSAVLRVQRLEGSGGRVRVSWRVVPGTATAGEDFEEGAAGTANFADGQTIRAIYVPLLSDTNFEGSETFVVELTSNRRDVRIGPIPKATVTIRDDD